MLEAEDRVLGLQLKGFAVESTVQGEGGEQVDGEELTGEVDCGGRRTGWEIKKTAEGGNESK